MKWMTEKSMNWLSETWIQNRFKCLLNVSTKYEQMLQIVDKNIKYLMRNEFIINDKINQNSKHIIRDPNIRVNNNNNNIN